MSLGRWIELSCKAEARCASRWLHPRPCPDEYSRACQFEFVEARLGWGEIQVFSAADFENGTGVAHVEGNLSLDYVRVKCVANIDLSTLQGKGYLVKLEAKEESVA